MRQVRHFLKTTVCVGVSYAIFVANPAGAIDLLPTLDQRLKQHPKLEGFAEDFRTPPVQKVLNGLEHHYTVLAPTNEAWEKVQASKKSQWQAPAAKGEISQAFAKFVIPRRVNLDAIEVGESKQYKTLSGSEVTFTRFGPRSSDVVLNQQNVIANYEEADNGWVVVMKTARFEDASAPNRQWSWLGK